LSSLEKGRHATWLELFYDLVFAAAVSQIGHLLYVNNSSITAFLGTASLFVPVYWAWIGVTFYSTRFETDDLIHRLMVLLQMMGAAALTINIHDALGETSGNFAISYAAIRAFLVNYIMDDISDNPYTNTFYNLGISTCYRYHDHNFGR
jgi:low temperature requirement protein LtrA